MPEAGAAEAGEAGTDQEEAASKRRSSSNPEEESSVRAEAEARDAREEAAASTAAEAAAASARTSAEAADAAAARPAAGAPARRIIQENNSPSCTRAGGEPVHQDCGSFCGRWIFGCGMFSIFVIARSIFTIMQRDT